jgi:hypothetical protein
LDCLGIHAAVALAALTTAAAAAAVAVVAAAAAAILAAAMLSMLSMGVRYPYKGGFSQQAAAAPPVNSWHRSSVQATAAAGAAAAAGYCVRQSMLLPLMLGACTLQCKHTCGVTWASLSLVGVSGELLMRH